KIGFGYHAGLGIITGGEGFRSFWGYSAGFKFFPYKSQFIDIQYGTIGILYQEDYLGNIINQEVLIGPSALLGGDWFFSQYFGMNGSVGASFNVSHPGVQSVFLVIEMGLMVKFK
ncbi:MAG: hypothetical protein KKA81_07550, partial [Bacteroidetes bacterium]|nr:hypothetical protein [Bacteroidota bacterium]